MGQGRNNYDVLTSKACKVGCYITLTINQNQKYPGVEPRAVLVKSQQNGKFLLDEWSDSDISKNSNFFPEMNTYLYGEISLLKLCLKRRYQHKSQFTSTSTKWRNPTKQPAFRRPQQRTVTSQSLRTFYGFK